MQPITRVTANSFCRTCLQDLTPKPGAGEYLISEKEDLEKWLQAATGVRLSNIQLNIFPNKICFACYVKARIFQEYKMKTYCAGEVIKQVAEEQHNNEPVIKKLATVCRICLNYMKPAKSVNIFENAALLKWLNETSMVSLQNDNENIPKFVCNKCYKHLNVNLEFQSLAIQSLEYLKNILELTTEEMVNVTEVDCRKKGTCISNSEIEEKAPILPHEIMFDEIKVEEDLQVFDTSMDGDIFAEPLLKCEVEIKDDLFENNEANIDDSIKEQQDNEKTVKIENENNFVAKIKKKQKERKSKRVTRSKSTKIEDISQAEPVYITRDDNTNSEDDSDNDHDGDSYEEELHEEHSASKRNTKKIKMKKRKFDFHCAECDKRFSVQWIYEGHMRGHLGDSRPYHCTECTKTFRHQSDLYPHLYGVHNFTQKLKTGRYATEAERIVYKCEFCCKVFKRQDHYRDHVDSVHHLIKRFPCSYCPRRFSLARTMRLHEMRHTGECPYVCDTCGRRFRKTTDLKIHIEMHTTPPELLCPICKRGKSSIDELKEHIAMHEQHQCTKCGLLFKRASHLVQHDRAVHLKIRPFKCKYCDKSFALSGTCQAHERVHTGERPQICNYCGVTYKTKRGLQGHVKRHESDEVDTKTRKKIIKNAKINRTEIDSQSLTAV